MLNITNGYVISSLVKLSGSHIQAAFGIQALQIKSQTLKEESSKSS